MKRTLRTLSLLRSSVLFLLVVFVTLSAAPAHAQDAVVASGYKNTIGLGAGGGFSLENDAPNVSVTGQYTRELSGPWSVSVSLGYDKEFRKKQGRTSESQEVSLQATLGYGLTDQWSVFGGFARGIVEKDEGKSWEWAGEKNWAVGAGVSYSIPINDRVSIGPSVVTAYSFENSEVRMEFELEVSYGF